MNYKPNYVGNDIFLENRRLILYILQIATIYNAITLGWRVRKIGSRKFELSKKISELGDFDFADFVHKIVSTQIM